MLSIIGRREIENWRLANHAAEEQLAGACSRAKGRAEAFGEALELIRHELAIAPGRRRA